MEDPTELRKSFIRAGRIAIQAQCEANRATGAPMQDREIEARKWLAELDAEDLGKRDAREESTLSLAKEANDIARDANRYAARAERWAMYAAIAAVIALIISITNRAH